MSNKLREALEQISKMTIADYKHTDQYIDACRIINNVAKAALKEDGWVETDKQKVFEVIDTVRAQYPSSVFPDNGTSPDAKAGIMARLICDNIKREMEIMFNEEPPLPQPPTTRVVEVL